MMKEIEQKAKQGHASYLHGHAIAALVSGILVLVALLVTTNS